MESATRAIEECSDPDDHFERIVDRQHAGKRLDRFLQHHFSDISRSLIGHAIKTGSIVVNHQQKKSGYRVKEGDTVEGTIELEGEIEIVPEKLDLNILYEDDFLLVLSKPPGLVVHPGAGNHSGTLVNGLVHYCNSISDAGPDRLRPGIVHRLDKDTSGVMVVAKTMKCHTLLSEMFKNRQIEKSYLALVKGSMERSSGRLVASIGRHPVNRKMMRVCEGQQGRYAVTRWKVVDELPGPTSLVQLDIETGRTHQIRVHMKHLGHPVIGDELYGGKAIKHDAPRQMLHAFKLGFEHPITGERKTFSAPLWQDFQEILDHLNSNPGVDA